MLPEPYGAAYKTATETGDGEVAAAVSSNIESASNRNNEITDGYSTKEEDADEGHALDNRDGATENAAVIIAREQIVEGEVEYTEDSAVVEIVGEVAEDPIHDHYEADGSDRFMESDEEDAKNAIEACREETKERNAEEVQMTHGVVELGGTVTAFCQIAQEGGLKQAPSLPPIQRRRNCTFPGCTNVIKSQGHCQRHGAQPKRCKAPDCSNQAQGSHRGYCKRHWREFEAPPELRRAPRKTPEASIRVEPVGESVFDKILPSSYVWRQLPPRVLKKIQKGDEKETLVNKKRDHRNALSADEEKDKEQLNKLKSARTIPIARHLVENAHLEPGWHRKNERLSRGILPPKSTSTQLDSWERRLAIFELALIAGSDTDPAIVARYNRLLAHAWGREKGFHKVILDQLCSRRGDLERKRPDYEAKHSSDEKKAARKTKLDVTVTARKRKLNPGANEREEVRGPSKNAKKIAVPCDNSNDLLQVNKEKDATAAQDESKITDVSKGKLVLNADTPNFHTPV